MHIDRIHVRRGLAALAVGGLATAASAQSFDNQWVEFRLVGHQADVFSASNLDTETDLAWGDLDGDGWTDLAVVRKQPFTSAGKRTNVLLMNEGGFLTDRTADFASASDVVGDEGFLTATNDRDVVLTDVDLDGLLDVVTATTLSDGEPKHVGHPRVYVNLGHEPGGAWLGLMHEDARVPQLFHYTTGAPENPRFCSVDAGDVTGDGYPDLYFGDYDSSGAGGVQQPSNKDLNDRLLVNDGAGYFTDQSQARMSAQMLLSAFGTAVAVADFNGDGRADIAKDTALNAPQYVAISYNSVNEGQFQIFDNFHVGFAPYHINTGDLNNDGRLDMIFSDDGDDRYRINTGNDQFGRVIWTDAQTYDFLPGSPDDDGFGSNNLVADLDMDGWNDVLIADVDVDIGGYGRRLHIYENTGDVVGGTPDMVENREFSDDSGWVGVVGMTTDDMRGTHDVAVFDLDNDGDNDMVVSRSVGTFVWENLTDPVFCQTDFGFAGPGGAALSMCGQPLWAGNEATVQVAGAPAGAPAFLAVGLSDNPTPVLGGTLVPVPAALVVSGATNGAGTWSLPFTSTGSGPNLYLQAVVFDAGQLDLFQITNALEVVLN